MKGHEAEYFLPVGYVLSRTLELLMKYIICEDFSGQPVPFLFPNRVSHADMREQLPYARVISAGYILLTEGQFVCSGGDAELNVSSRPEDAECIAAFFARRNPHAAS